MIMMIMMIIGAGLPGDGLLTSDGIDRVLSSLLILLLEIK